MSRDDSTSKASASATKSAVEDMIDGMLQGLVDSGESERMQGLDIDRLRAAMTAPGAAETVAEIQAMGSDSKAGVGQPAPDFELPYLPGQSLPGQDLPRQGRVHAERVRLSTRYANRPVALVFGSYT